MQQLAVNGTFFEGPRWHNNSWWVSDFYAHEVLRIGPNGKAQLVAQIDGQPSGLGFMPNGDLLIVSMTDRRIVRRTPDGRCTTHADLTAYTGGHVNDMVVDRAGRAYVGNFGFDIFGGAAPAATHLLRVDPDGSVTVVAEQLWCPNGTVISDDGRTLIIAESFAARLTAFTVDDEGNLSERRIWAAFGAPPAVDSLETIGEAAFAPDGCALDAEGHVWVADAFNARACRVAPGGDIVDEVRLDNGYGIYACALGGPDGHGLLLCAAPDFNEASRRAQREAALYIHDVTVPRGAGLP